MRLSRRLNHRSEGSSVGVAALIEQQFTLTSPQAMLADLINMLCEKSILSPQDVLSLVPNHSTLIDPEFVHGPSRGDVLNVVDAQLLKATLHDVDGKLIEETFAEIMKAAQLRSSMHVTFKSELGVHTMHANLRLWSRLCNLVGGTLRDSAYGASVQIAVVGKRCFGVKGKNPNSWLVPLPTPHGFGFVEFERILLPTDCGV